MIKLCAFLTLVLAMMSLWVHRKVYVWGTLLILSLCLAYFGRLVQFEVLFAIGALCLGHLFLHHNIKGIPRGIVILLVTILSYLFMWHIAPGFFNWQLASNVVIKPDATPYSLWWNYDKPFVGFFILALNLPLLHSRFHFYATFKKTIPLAILGSALLLFLAYYFNFIRFDPKLHPLLPLWFFANLFLVVIPEEAFFRGFLQYELAHAFHHKAAPYIAIVIASILFGISHLSPTFIAFSTLAGLLYGLIFHLTGAIEGPIFAHITLNLIHFLLFTYPFLAT